MSLGPATSGIESWLCHLVASLPRASPLIFLSLILLICEMEIIIIIISVVIGSL